jgi:uncharacterized membrane protein YgcG
MSTTSRRWSRRCWREDFSFFRERESGRVACSISAAKLPQKYDGITDGEASARRRPRHWNQVLSVMMVMVVMMMMMVVMAVVVVVAVAPLRRHVLFRRGRGRRGWRGAGLRRGGDRGESDSGGHKHSHKNFIHHFYLLRDSSNPR